MAKPITPARRLAPRMNLFTPSTCRVWCVLTRGELEPRPARVRQGAIGTPPDWLDMELGLSGWEGFLEACLDMPFVGLDRGGWERMAWAMDLGLAPGQPFLVEFTCPRGTSYLTDCGTEYDTEYDGAVIAIAPMAPLRAARLWEEWTQAEVEAQKLAAEYAAAREAERQQLLSRALADPSALWLWHDTYGGFDGMPPYGVRIHLRSAHGDMWLASGDDDEGDTGKALARLAVKAAAVMPGTTPEFIRTLRYVKPTPKPTTTESPRG